MDWQSLITKQKCEINNAERSLNDALNALSQFHTTHETMLTPGMDTITNIGDSIDFENGNQTDNLDLCRNLQLVLQYRLSSYDAIRALCQYQQSLWQILGVSSLASSEINYERLAYALGSDDLHFVLLMLNQLANALLKLIGRLERKNANKKMEELNQRKQYANKHVNIAVSKEPQAYLQKAIDKQAIFTAAMLDLTQSLQGIAGAPDIGEVLDEIAALKGPISRFYMALQNGMVLAGSLYQQLSVKTSLAPQLTKILNEVHQALQLAAPHLEPQRFFVPEKAQQLSGQDLEARATYKRLRNFFHN